MKATRLILGLSASALATIVPADPANEIYWPYRTFKSVNFTPPVPNITHSSPNLYAEGYLFFAPDGPLAYQTAPVIFDMDGTLIWNGPETHAFNFGLQRYRGEEVIVWWNGTIFREPVGRGHGEIVMLNRNYEQIGTVTLEGNFVDLEPGETFESNIDLHEILFTDRGTVVVTANNVTQADLTSVGGAVDGWTVDSLVYEIDIETNEVLFEWKALDHLDQLPFNISVYPLGAEGFTGANQSLAWGYFHINAAEPYDGGYILSARYLCSAIAIDGADGHVKWRLSGREGGDFALVGDKEETGFCYQHDIRIREQSDSGLAISMHDNYNSPIGNNTIPSTGKKLHLDFETMQATLEQRLTNDSGPIFATAQGNYQLLSSGNIFVGHGWLPLMEEFSPSGEILTTVQFGPADPRPGGGFESLLEPALGYRDFKFPWVGCPSAKPDVVAEAHGEGVTVWVSWNGATEVEGWEVFAGEGESQLRCVKTVDKSGFETETRIEPAAFVQIKPVMKMGCACNNVQSSNVVAVS